MALDLSTLTAQEQAAAIYIGYYDRAPDPAGCAFWESVVANPAVSLADIATDFSTQAETQAEHPFFVAPTAAAANAFITELYLNLFNREPDMAGLSFWSGVLQASIDGTGSLSVGQIILEIIQGAQDTTDGNDLTTIKNKIDVATAWTDAADAAGLTTVDGYLSDADAQASAKSVIDGVTDDAATVTAAKATATSFFTEGQTFLLTTGVDRGTYFTGTAGNDTFIAYPAGDTSDVETLTSLDVIDGGDGTDTLDIAAVGEDWAAPTSATVQNIEIANIVSDRGITVDASEWTGLQTLNATGSVAATLTAAATTDVNVADATGAVSVTGGADVAVTDSTGAITVDDAAGAVSVADAAGTVTINGGADVNVSGVAGMVATIGGTTAATGNITLTHAAQGADAITVDGGVDVTVTAEGVTTGDITVGGSTLPTGAINVTQTGAAYTADTPVSLGDITIDGGTTVNVTQVASSDTTAAEDDGSAATTILGDVFVTGGEATTSVTVTQDAPNDAVKYVAAKDDTPATVGEMGVVNGDVTITDVNVDSTTKAGTITTVTLNNFGLTTAVNSSALTTVNLSGTGGTLDILRGALTPTANTLTINADGLTTGAINDNGTTAVDGFTTINLNATGDATTIAALNAADMTTLNITGDAAVELTILAAKALTSVTAGDGGVTIGSELETATAFTSGAGDDSIIVGATTEAIATGAGDDVVTLEVAALGTDDSGDTVGTIDAGDGTDTLVMSAANAVTASSDDTLEGAISNFEKLELGVVSTTGEVQLNNLDDINDVTVEGVASGKALTLSGASTGVDVRFADDTQTATTVTLAEDGDADVANIHATTADNTATLAALTLDTFETVNFNTADTDTDETDATIEVALTAADATAITVTGNAGLDLSFTGTALTSFDASGVTAGEVTYTTGALENAATLTGGAGADTFDATSATASVTLSGNAGNDTLTGSAKADEIDGGEGNDSITAAAGNDTVDGGAGDDVITGGDGADVIDGGEGDDVITGGAGGDTITTGAGADLVVFAVVADSTGAARDTVTDFETGVDKLQFALTGANVDVSGFATEDNFTNGVIGLNSAAGDLFYSAADGKLFVEANGDGQINQSNDYVVSIGEVAAGDFNFDITGTSAANVLTGGLGDDTFTGDDGEDIITSGGGDDVITDYDTDVIVFSGDEVVAAEASGIFTDADGNEQMYASTEGGLVAFAEPDDYDPTDEDSESQWTLAEKKAAVQADEDLSAAESVSLITDGDDVYVYYAGATDEASDDQFMKITGGSGLNTIDDTVDDGGIQLSVGSTPVAGSLTQFTFTSEEFTGDNRWGQDNNGYSSFTVFSFNQQGTVDATYKAMAENAYFQYVGWAGFNAAEIIADTADTALASFVNGKEFLFSSGYKTAWMTGAPDSVDSGDRALDESSSDEDMLLAPDAYTSFYDTDLSIGWEMTGGSGSDLIFGSAGVDAIDGGAGADFILGGNGADSLSGGAGADALMGGNGADSLTGDAGADVLTGGAGNDTLIADDTDIIDGGDDTDTAAFAAAVSATNLLDADLVNVENVTVAGAFTFDFSAQTEKLNINGDDNGNTILVGSGGASIYAQGGNDDLTGSAVADTLSGGADNDTITGGVGADSLIGGGDNDVYVYSGTADVSAGETITEAASGGTDRIQVNGTTDFSTMTDADSFNEIEELFINGAYTATFTGAQLTGETISLLSTAPAADVQSLVVTATAGGTTDLSGVSAGTNWTAGTDTVTINGANSAAENITGTQTNDAINGGSGNDTIDGGDGDDVITGGAGADQLTGGLGSDTFVFATKAETGTYAGADTDAALMDAIADFVVADDTIQLGTGAAAFGTGITFTGTTVMNVATAVTLTTADYADLDAVMAALESAAAGTASDATTAQAVVFTVAADGTTGGDFDSLAAGTYLAINDHTGTWTAADTIINITGATGTLTAADFAFV